MASGDGDEAPANTESEADDKAAAKPKKKSIKQLREEKEAMEFRQDFEAREEALRAYRKWEAQPTMPTDGEALKNGKLREALESGKTEFEQSEFESFGVKRLKMNSFIRVGGQYYRPVGLAKGRSVVSDR